VSRRGKRLVIDDERRSLDSIEELSPPLDRGVEGIESEKGIAGPAERPAITSLVNDDEFVFLSHLPLKHRRVASVLIFFARPWLGASLLPRSKKA
jgi:hypothetical protein